MSQKLINSYDVTLACKFHTFGFCKFGSKCRHFHIPSTCFNPTKCKETSCQARHPKSCRYYMMLGFCKFGIDRSFIHPTPIESYLDFTKDVKKLKEDLDNVLDYLKVKDS